MSEAIDMLIGMTFGVVVGFALALVMVGPREDAAIRGACGPCDHEAECGAFECVVGKEGWQRKEGAK